MTPSREIEQLTAALVQAVERGDLTAAEQALRRRGALLQPGPTDAPLDPQSLLASDNRAIEALRQRQSALRQEIDRLRRARGLNPAFSPARQGRKRLDLQA
ncbi:MAG: hypothetical protein GC160_06650 [Acidobacteria bacterium]|nr:hypothetical protein [Acidobacteriota bacterium]